MTKKTSCVTIKEIDDGIDLQHIQVKSLKTFLSGRIVKNIPVYYNQLSIFYPTNMWLKASIFLLWKKPFVVEWFILILKQSNLGKIKIKLSAI